MTIRRNWRREELLLALNLYCCLPFGQYHSRNPEITALARLIGRTADAVAMKLSNFASFDPYHHARGVRGLPNAGQADRAIWDEFSANWAELATESELARMRLLGGVNPPDPAALSTDALDIPPTTEAERVVRVRLGQQFFRRMIITSYAHKCCVCEMPITELLVASHIVPWRDAENLRVNPYNGLCLCAVHDKGFDRGLFTLDEGYEVVIGPAIKEHYSNEAVQRMFRHYAGKTIAMPDKFRPEQQFLEIHRNKYFRD